jgi:hypothetical protein
MTADAQRDDERLAWLEPMRHALDEARVAPANVEQVGDQLEAILLRLAPPPDPQTPAR